jgi:hypothetical protein
MTRRHYWKCLLLLARNVIAHIGLSVANRHRFHRCFTG